MFVKTEKVKKKYSKCLRKLINLVKEKNLGTYLRLRCSPVPFWMLMGGKVMAFLVICMIQFAVMLGISYAIFPLLGLIQFDPGHQLPLMSLVALIAGLAAIGLGILIGTIAKTQEQSAPFGAILVIILAALGGVWVPTFIMPQWIQSISFISPIRWTMLAIEGGVWRNFSIGEMATPCAILITVGLFALLTAWNDFIAPLILINDTNRMTLPLAVANLRGQVMGVIDYGATEAGVVVLALPCIVLFLVLQRHYVRGFMSGAFKG